jgi:hypothetical protein
MQSILTQNLLYLYIIDANRLDNGNCSTLLVNLLQIQQSFELVVALLRAVNNEHLLYCSISCKDLRPHAYMNCLFYSPCHCCLHTYILLKIHQLMYVCF